MDRLKYCNNKEIDLKTNGEEEQRPANSRFAKAGLSCFYDSEVLNSSFVHLMKFSAKNPRLRKAAKRQAVKKVRFLRKPDFLAACISL